MGLDTSHDCWHGPYSAFYRWCRLLAKAAGLPPLDLMEGFYQGEDESPWVLIKNSGPLGETAFDSIKQDVLDFLPIKWKCLKPDPLYILLNHSDCDGKIKNKDCKPIAESLKKLVDKIPDNERGFCMKHMTEQFIRGLLLAAKKGENVEFY